MTIRARLVDGGDLADDEGHPLVEQGPLRALEVGGAFAAHGDVHEAGLVDMVAGRVDDEHLDIARIDPTPKLPDEEVGGEGAPDTPTKDDDPFHGATAASRR